MLLKAAVGAFFNEFAKVETQFVGMVLRALSKDDVLVENAEALLDFEARLTLLERMALARGVSPAMMSELEPTLVRARKLQEQRDDVARCLAAADLHAAKPPPAGSAKYPLVTRRFALSSHLAKRRNLLMPGIETLERYAREAVELQQAFDAFAREVERLQGSP